MLAALKAQFHSSDVSNRMLAVVKLMKFCMEGSTKIQDHIDRYDDLVTDMINLGEDMSDERKALHLIAFLPSSYDTLSLVLIHRDKTTITYNEVVRALLTDDVQHQVNTPGKGASLSIALRV